jgi:hypothetical protein
MALGKYKLALRDYERVCKVRPNDKDAKLKFTECRKIVQQIAFNKAISVEDQKAASVAEALDIESMTVEDKYDGPKLNIDQPSGKDTNTYYVWVFWALPTTTLPYTAVECPKSLKMFKLDLT